MWKSVLVLLLVLCGCSSADKDKAEFQTETKDLAAILKDLHKDLAVGVTLEKLNKVSKELTYEFDQLKDKALIKKFNLIPKLSTVCMLVSCVTCEWTNMELDPSKRGELEAEYFSILFDEHPELKKESTEGGLLVEGKVSINRALPAMLSMLSDSVGKAMEELKNPTMKK